MPPLSHPEFERLLGGLNRDEFRRFVADLWIARGWHTEIDGDIIIATRESPVAGRQILRIEDGGFRRRLTTVLSSGTDQIGNTTDADIVIVRDRSPKTVREVPDAGSDATLLDVKDLYGLALYGIDRGNLVDLCRVHFDRTLPRRDPDPPSEDARDTRSFVVLRGLLAGRPLYSIVVGVILLSVIVAGALAGAGLSTTQSPQSGEVAASTPSGTPTLTAKSVRWEGYTSGDSPGQTGSTDHPLTLSSVDDDTSCSPPPERSHPQELQPRLSLSRSNVSPSLHEMGWEFRSSWTLSRVDPGATGQESSGNEELSEARYAATYRSPVGNRYEVEIDRWETPAIARAASTQPWRSHLRFTWGRYTLMATGNTGNGTMLRSSTALSPAHQLLAAVWVPNRDRPLGIECVSVLSGYGRIK